MLIEAPSEIPIRAARSAPVEGDDTRERGKSFKHPCRRLVLPDQLDVGGEPGHDDEIELAATEDLVGDVHVAAARVSGLRPR
jgi:hypothetical protein